MKITPPNANRPIVDNLLQMVQSFRSWARAVSREAGKLRGSGSPEGVVEALPDQMYYDDTGGPGNNLYIKKLDNIGGDKSQGWELI